MLPRSRSSDGMDLVEAGYGWRELGALVAACGPVNMVQH